jgi:hypothetical protein
LLEERETSSEWLELAGDVAYDLLLPPPIPYLFKACETVYEIFKEPASHRAKFKPRGDETY